MKRGGPEAPVAPAGLAARAAALGVLGGVREGLAFDQALDRSLGTLPDADRRLAHELAAGVLRRQDDLDARLRPLLVRGFGSVAPPLRDVLRLGAYQLAWLDRVPAHAAVWTAVELARHTGGEPAARFVNAVLRRLGGRAAAPAYDLDPAGHLAARHSHPLWLVRRWLERFGAEDTARLLAWDDATPDLVLQPARLPLAALETALRAAGIGTRRAPFDAGLVVSATRPAELPGFAAGDFVVQDPAQALVVRFAAVPAGARVYDACAAPGGKAIALGRAAGLVLAGELKRERMTRLMQNLQRAGSGREFAVCASALFPPVRGADVVLLDAPCLGTGTLARHPDARGRVTADALGRLAATQAELLGGAATAVRPGGWLVYATCSLEPEENERQIDAFLARNPAFQRDTDPSMPPELLSPAGDLCLLPHRHATDGAYAARLRRSAR